MGYRIIYGPEQKHPVTKRIAGNYFLLYTGCFFVLFLVAVHVFWPEGTAAVQSIFQPFDEQTAACFQEMVASIGEGESIADAVYGFCQEIISNAGIS